LILYVFSSIVNCRLAYNFLGRFGIDSAGSLLYSIGHNQKQRRLAVEAYLSMRTCFGSLRYLLLALALPLAARDVQVWVVNTAGASVSVIDTATNKVVRTIEGFEVPHGVSFSPDGSRAWIGDESLHVMHVVDTKTGKIIKKIPLAGKPNKTDVSRDGKLAFACIAEHLPLSAIQAVDTTTLEVVKTIPMGEHMHDCYTMRDGKYEVGGSDSKGNFVAAVDIKTLTEAWKVQFDKGIRTISFENGPDGSTKRMFVQLGDFNGFAVVDFATHKEVSRINLPDEPSGMMQGEESHGAGVTPDGKEFWINSGRANSVFVYSLPDLKLLGHVALHNLIVPGKKPMGGEPHWVTFTPDSKIIYISSPGLSLLTAIDVKTMKIVAEIPVGEGSRRIDTVVLP
jgi:YVTN family beta-propeller protein